MKLFFKPLILLYICFSIKTDAQNLISNPSFENFRACPDTNITYPFYENLDSTWFQYNSVDYFNACDTTSYYGVPTNFIGGYQYPHSGNAYVGLIAYSSTAFDREYLEIKLASPLIANQTYYIQFYASLADTDQYAIENIGALFTDTLFDPFPYPTYNWQTGLPQVKNAAGNILNDKINWMPILGSFVAVGGEQYMTIGNFSTDAETVRQYFGGTAMHTLGAYYYIDGVYLSNTQPAGINENQKSKETVCLYPNPNNGNITLEYELKQNEQGILTIHDLAGKTIADYKLDVAGTKLQVSNLQLQPGIYLYEILVNGKKIAGNKLVIIK